jgi:sialate O-acetylesterase
MKTILKTVSFFVVCIFFQNVASSQVKLPKLISNGMVLQRGVETKIWGWAAADEKITVEFNNSTYKTTANSSGDWSILLPAMKAGGPYKMQIKASNIVTIDDILFGEVWVCSGQSNMELPIRRVCWIYEEEIAKVSNNLIREFVVPKKYNFKAPQKDLEDGNWKRATQENIMGFSAVGYFFAKELYDKYKVPIGLINSALGGSPVEAWVSEEVLKKYPHYYKEAQKFKNDSLIEKIKQEDKARSDAWYQQLNQKDLGLIDSSNLWNKPEHNDSDWSGIQVPSSWQQTNLKNTVGAIWFRTEIELPQNVEGEKAQLILGRIVDADFAYVNGKFVGTTGYQYPPRRYDVPAGLLKGGKNSIAVRVIVNTGTGEFVPDKDYVLVVDKDTFDLSGKWKYKISAKMPPLKSQTFIRWKPVGLYNAMIAPLFNYKMKGVVWYQGESNVGRHKEYAELLPALITTWREKWDEGDFPFLIVQLANFLETKDKPSDSYWALLREAQLKTLSVKNTGMAVCIDLGEWNDIHPLNKKDVGRRLAKQAGKVAYNEVVVGLGPVYDAMKIKDAKVTLTFKNIGSGLVTKNGEMLKQFAIAGKDKQFVWAKATIENNKVVVWSEKVKNPVAVRYAWADNPEGANLYNKEGLPASPFRTDDW